MVGALGTPGVPVTVLELGPVPIRLTARTTIG